MAGLYGSTRAPGLQGGPAPFDDPRRRRFGGPGASDFQGGSIAGPEQSLARLIPFLMGISGPNLSGLPSGMDFSNISMDLRNAVGGPNVAPGAPQGTAVNQPNNPVDSYSVNIDPGTSGGGGGGGAALQQLLSGLGGGKKYGGPYA